MRILVVGNIFKDVYLNIDDRAEKFEVDEDGVRWLDISFDTSEHRFFNRHSSFGGAVISVEVLGNMKHNVSYLTNDISYGENGLDFTDGLMADLYRYILISNEQAAYFAPSFEHETVFEAPAEPVDYIFVDRSANLVDSRPLLDYLAANPETKLAMHLKTADLSQAAAELARRADLIFAEERLGFEHQNIIYLGQNKMSYQGINLRFETPRADLMTHLSIYSILAATILGGLLAGMPVEKCLKLAKTNVENSNLDACLSLERLEELSA